MLQCKKEFYHTRKEWSRLSLDRLLQVHRSRKQRLTMAQELWFCGVKNLGKTQTESAPTEAPNADGEG